MLFYYKLSFLSKMFVWKIFYYFLQKSFPVYTQRQKAEDNKSRDNNNNILEDCVSAKNKSTETCLQGKETQV